MGPPKINQLSCIKCDKILIEAKQLDVENFEIKHAPSKNMGDILDFWQCASESYSRLIDETTGKPHHHRHQLLFDLNSVEVHQDLVKALETNHQCNNFISDSGKHLFVNNIKEL
jgi:hypothetical protein